MFEKLDETSLKEFVRQTAYLAFTQEKIINNLKNENEKLNQELIYKNEEIKDLSAQLNGIKSNLLGCKYIFFISSTENYRFNYIK